MAQGDVIVFNDGNLEYFDGTHDLDTDIIKCAVLTNAVIPTQTDVNPRLGLYTEVAVSPTYIAGGIILSISLTKLLNVVTFKPITNPSWPADAGGAANAFFGLMYNSSDPSDEAFAFVDLAGPFDMTAGDLTINWNSLGVFTNTILP